MRVVILVGVLLALAARGALAAVKFLPGVDLALRPEMSRALPLIEAAHVDIGLARGAIITSGADGVHSDASLHYVGLAVDIRTRDLTAIQIQGLTNALRRRLNGTDTKNRPYQVVVEQTHIHIEYQP